MSHYERCSSGSPITLKTVLSRSLTLAEVAETENCECHLKVPKGFITSRIRCIVKEVRGYAQEAEPEEEEHQELQKLEVHGNADIEILRTDLLILLLQLYQPVFVPNKGYLLDSSFHI